MIFIDERPAQPAGGEVDQTAWLEGVISSIPRVIIVNVDTLGIPDKQIRMQAGRRILARLIAKELGGGDSAGIPGEKLDAIESLLDPSIQVHAPHHMARRIFKQTDKTLAMIRDGQYARHQRIAGVYTYHWDSLRSMCLSKTSPPKFRTRD